MSHEQKTRQQLLEAAGQVFAEKGFDRATGKEICERVGANPAAINYYFQGMEGLYIAVLMEAHRRLVDLNTLADTLAGITDPKAKLRALAQIFVQALMKPSSAWILRVIGREVVSPSPFVADMRRRQVRPKLQIVQSVIAELLNLPLEHPTVVRASIFVAGPCQMLLVTDRANLKYLFPGLRLDAENADAFAEQFTQFAIAGLNAIAKQGDTCKK